MANSGIKHLSCFGLYGGDREKNGEEILQIRPQPVQTVMKGSQGLKAIWLSRVKGTLCPKQEEGTPMHLHRVTYEAGEVN